MKWGKFSFCARGIAWSLLVAAGVSAVPAHARPTACDQLGTALQKWNQEAIQLGFYRLDQPIVYADDAAGVTEEAARAASNTKIDQFQNWLNGRSQEVLSSRALQNCAYRVTASEWLKGAQEELAFLRSFNGPYRKSEKSLASSPAVQSNGVSLDLPCRKPEEPVNGLRACGEVLRDITGLAESYLKKMNDAIYRGCDLEDSSILADPASCIPKNTVATCNAFDGITEIANGVAEKNSNHLGKKCGDPTSVSTRVSGRSCRISTQEIGSLEQSYFQGNMIRAFDCHFAQVKNELAQGKLKLTAATGLDPSKKYEQQIDLIKKGEEALRNFKNIAQIEACTSNADATGPALQSACMMFTHRKALEQHFAHLAAVEVVSRARRSFERFDAGSMARGFFADFKSFLQDNQGSANCQGKKDQCNPGTYLSRCYKPLWNDYFVSRSNSVWNAEVCQ